MAIIKSVDEIRALIPTFKDLARCGNFASVESDIIKSNPLYAFSVGGNFKRNVKTKFILIGLTNLYALVLTAYENDSIGRYCDYMAIPRDITKPISPDNWKWNEDAIGLSFKSDNASESIIYFGTEEKDGEKIRELFNKGLRTETISYKKLDQTLRNTVMETLRVGKIPTDKTTIEKRNVGVSASVQAPPPLLPRMCLPSPEAVTKPEQKTNYMDVLARYARMIYGKEEEHPAEELLSNGKEKTITTETVYV